MVHPSGCARRRIVPAYPAIDAHLLCSDSSTAQLPSPHSLQTPLRFRPNGTGDAHSLPNQQARAGWRPSGVGPSAQPARRAGTWLAWPPATAAPAAPHPPGDFRRRLVMEIRTSCSAALRVAAARIPAGGGRSLISGHSSAPHSPVLRTWEIGCFTHPTAWLAFSASRNTLAAQDRLPPGRGQRPCPRLRLGHGRRSLGPAPHFWPHRRLDAAWRLCSAGRSTGLNGLTGNPTGVGCARRAGRPLVFAAAHTGSTPLGRRATRLGSAERSAPHASLSLSTGPPGGRLRRKPENGRVLLRLGVGCAVQFARIDGRKTGTGPESQVQSSFDFLTEVQP